MRQRTKIDSPNSDPKASEFEKFDSFMRVLITKPPQKKAAAKRPGQERKRRLPRP